MAATFRSWGAAERMEKGAMVVEGVVVAEMLAESEGSSPRPPMTHKVVGWSMTHSGVGAVMRARGCV